MVCLKTTPEQIREKGLKALTKALGPFGMVRFLQQYDMGSGDYTKEREEWLRGETVSSIVRKIRDQ